MPLPIVFGLARGLGSMAGGAARLLRRMNRREIGFGDGDADDHYAQALQDVRHLINNLQISIDVKGTDELCANLMALPAKLEKRILRGALRAAAGVIAQEAKRRAPVKTGKLRKSIRVSTGSRGGSIYATIRVGGQRKGEAFYAHMVEFGTSPHVIVAGSQLGANRIARERAVLSIAGTIVGPKVSHPGSAPRPFMRPALDSQWQQAVRVMAGYIEDRLHELVRP